MFQACFIYNYKELCYIYYLEIEEQNEDNEEKIKKLNKDKIEEEAQAAFDKQECEKERKWDNKGQKWLKKRASQEAYQKNN